MCHGGFFTKNNYSTNCDEWAARELFIPQNEHIRAHICPFIILTGKDCWFTFVIYCPYHVAFRLLLKRKLATLSKYVLKTTSNFLKTRTQRSTPKSLQNLLYISIVHTNEAESKV